MKRLGVSGVRSEARGWFSPLPNALPGQNGACLVYTARTRQEELWAGRGPCLGLEKTPEVLKGPA